MCTRLVKLGIDEFLEILDQRNDNDINLSDRRSSEYQMARSRRSYSRLEHGFHRIPNLANDKFVN